MIKPSLFPLLLVSVLCFCVPAHARDYGVLDVIGDSTTFGHNPDFYHIPDARYGWVEMLFGIGGGDFPATQTLTLDTLWPGITRYNSCILGSTLDSWADPASTYTQAVLDHRPDIVLVQIGGIDLHGVYENDGIFSIDERLGFIHNLRALIERLQANTPRPDIILLNYFDVFDGMSLEAIMPDSPWHFKSQWIREGNEILQMVAEEKGCLVVDIYRAMLYHGYSEDFGSPLYRPPSYVRKPLNTAFEAHPNTNGHEAIYRAVYETLEGLIYARTQPETWPLY